MKTEKGYRKKVKRYKLKGLVKDPGKWYYYSYNYCYENGDGPLKIDSDNMAL